MIEHIALDKLAQFLTRVTQLLAPHGVVFFTTPNRLRRTPIFQRPINPYHVTEYAPWSLKRVLDDYFSAVAIRYITGNEHIMAAEWERGRTITPLRYYATGALAGLAGKMAGAPFLARPKWQLKIARTVARAEGKISKLFTRRAAAQWDRTRPFTVDDFHLSSEFDWWALDLLAEVRDARSLQSKVRG